MAGIVDFEVGWKFRKIWQIDREQQLPRRDSSCVEAMLWHRTSLDVPTVRAMDKLLLNQRTCELVEGSNHMIDSTIPAQNACPAESIPYTHQSIVTNYATQSQKYPANMASYVVTFMCVAT